MHLIGPLSFSMKDADLRRASLGHSEFVDLKVHSSFDEYLNTVKRKPYLVTTDGTRPYDQARYRTDDVFVFGNEGWGIPDDIAERFEPEYRLKIPQIARSRSLNLANAVAVVVYEALRQNGFKDLA